MMSAGRSSILMLLVMSEFGTSCTKDRATIDCHKQTCSARMRFSLSSFARFKLSFRFLPFQYDSTTNIEQTVRTTSVSNRTATKHSMIAAFVACVRSSLERTLAIVAIRIGALHDPWTISDILFVFQNVNASYSAMAAMQCTSRFCKHKGTTNENMLRQQTLGGRTYEIDPTGVGGDDKNKISGVLRQIVLGTGILLLSPALAASTIVMWLSPNVFRHKILRWHIPFICSKLDSMFHKERKVLLDGCQGSNVLDVGSGGGAYMRYFSKAKSVTALEPVEALHETIRRNAERYNVPTLTIFAVDVETYLRDHFSGEMFDWIVLGNVLCEVDDVRSTLDAVDKLLKPGTGTVYFSEHVACERGTWTRTLQDAFNPPWKTLSGGCNMNRETLRLIKSGTRNWEVISWNFPNVKIGLGPFLMGLAKKKDEVEASIV